MIRRPPRSTLVPDATRVRSTAGRADGRPRAGPALVRAACGGGATRHAAAGRLVPGGRRWWRTGRDAPVEPRSEEHTSELQSRQYLVCRLLLEKKNISRYSYL